MKLTYQQRNLLTEYLKTREASQLVPYTIEGNTLEQKVQVILDKKGKDLDNIFEYLPFDIQVDTVDNGPSLIRLLNCVKDNATKYSMVRESIKENFVQLGPEHQFFVLAEIPSHDLIDLALVADDLPLRWFFLKFTELLTLNSDYKKIERRLMCLINTFKTIEDVERTLYVDLLLRYATNARLRTHLKLLL